MADRYFKVNKINVRYGDIQVLKGSARLHIGNNVYKIKSGESFYFLPEKQHYLESRHGATVLWVSSPPSF